MLASLNSIPNVLLLGVIRVILAWSVSSPDSDDSNLWLQLSHEYCFSELLIGQWAKYWLLIGRVDHRAYFPDRDWMAW